MADKDQSFLFSFGNSSQGPLGCCARIKAQVEESALTILRDALPEMLEVPVWNADVENGIEYIRVYFNDKAITTGDIEEVNAIAETCAEGGVR